MEFLSFLSQLTSIIVIIMQVLVNHNTASASEIVSPALLVLLIVRRLRPFSLVAA